MALESEIKELNRLLCNNCKQKSYEDCRGCRVYQLINKILIEYTQRALTVTTARGKRPVRCKKKEAIEETKALPKVEFKHICEKESQCFVRKTEMKRNRPVHGIITILG